MDNAVAQWLKKTALSWIPVGLSAVATALGVGGEPATGWQWSRQTESLTSLFAQPGLSVFHLSFEKDDAMGIRYVWIATSQGLYRYDGYSTIRFGKHDGLPSDFVRCVLATSSGQVWVGTDQGAGVFDGKSFATAGSEKGLAGPNVRRIIEDRFGTLWFTSDSWPRAGAPGGLTRLRDGQWTAYHASDGLPNDYVVDEFTDSKARVFAMTSNGPARLVGRRWRPEPFAPLPTNTHWGSAAMVETPATGVVLSNGFSTWVLRGENWEKLGNPPRHNHGITTTRDGRILIAGGTKPAFMAFFEWTGIEWRQVSDEFRVPQNWGIYLTEAPDGSVWYAGIGCLQRWPRLAAEWRFLPGKSSEYFEDDRANIWSLRDSHYLSVFDGARWVDRGVFDQVWWQDPKAVWAIRSGLITRLGSNGNTNLFTQAETGLKNAMSVGVDERKAVWAIGTNAAGKGQVARLDGSRWQRFAIRHPGIGRRAFQATAAGGGFWYLFEEQSLDCFLIRVGPDGSFAIHPVPKVATSAFANELQGGPGGEAYVFGEAGLHRFSEKTGWERLDSRSARRVVSIGFQGPKGWMSLLEAQDGRDGITSLEKGAPFFTASQVTDLRRNASGDMLIAGGSGKIYGIGDGSGPFSIAVPGAPQVLSAGMDQRGVYWAGTSDGLLHFRPDGVPPETVLVPEMNQVLTGQPFSASAGIVNRFSLSSESASFSWRLDEGPWSSFSIDSRRQFDPELLAVGTHRVEVRARDHGLDVDPTPAVGTFEVRPLPIQDRPWFLPLVAGLVGAVGFSVASAAKAKRQLLQQVALEAKHNLERFRHIVATAQEGIAVLDVNGNCTMANEEFARIVGKPLPELLGSHYRNFVAKGRLEAFNEMFDKQRLGVAVSYEASLEFQHGIQYVHAALRPIPSYDGTFQGALATLTDIAEQKWAQEAVRQSEENYRLLFENSPNARLVIDRTTADVVLVNKAACKLYGYEKAEFLRKTLLELQLPDQVEVAKRILAAPSPSQAFQRRHKKCDGSFFVAEIFAHDLDFERRACRNVLVIDKTQEILAANRLKQSEQALATAQRLASIGSFEATLRNGQVTRVWSDELFRIVGLEPGENEGADWLAFLHPDDMEEAKRVRDLMFASEEPQTFEHRIIRKDGATRRVRAISQIRPIEGGLQCIGTVQDVTEVRAMHEQLQQAQRLDSIGRLAGGIAHDFNNLLTVINGYSKLLLKKVDSRTEIHEDVQRIVEAGQDAAELTKRLLAFGRKQVLKPTALDLSEVIRRALPLLRRLAGDTVRIETAFTQDVVVSADLVQINQILVNLTANARDAMPSGGVLNFSATRLADQVRLSVSDTGEGMSAATAQRIFEPFFTTKERQGGTGLGLSSVYGIVHQSGGVIQCFSEPGAGTRFEIWMPSTTAGTPQKSADPVVAAGVPADRGGRSVLVVDDQMEIRKYVIEVLSKHGYRVEEASNGREALERLRMRQRCWDLLLTDVLMAGMTGPELAAKAAAEFPPLRVLFMSGYTRGELDGRMSECEGSTAQILEKPFSPDALLQAVDQALRGVGEPRHPECRGGP